MSTNIGSENLVDGGAASGGDDGACDDGDGDGDGVAGAASALLSSASSVSWQPSPVPVDWGRRGHRRVVVRILVIRLPKKKNFLESPSTKALAALTASATAWSASSDL